uniref:Uncharacterized protein n=1 Tax=Cacopsylla melanoneura TaxID=428564 RepID=A0A8D8V964_9HEMI
MRSFTRYFIIIIIISGFVSHNFFGYGFIFGNHRVQTANHAPIGCSLIWVTLRWKYHSTLRTMCAVLNTTAFCINGRLCVPGSSFTTSQVMLDISPVAPIIIGTTFVL